MAKLTINTPGGQAPRQAEFMPPARTGIPVWLIAGGAVLFLIMFTGLVVTTTLLIVQSNRAETAQMAAATQLDEPSYADAANVVTRQDMNMLQAQPATGVAAPVTTTPVSANVPAAASANVSATRTVPAPIRLGAAHRYRVPSCVDYLDTLVKITTVRFPLGSDAPAPADMIRARNIATAVETCDEVKVVVEGHSDRRGSEQLNMDLSWFRAQSVIDQLQREGFDISAMQPRGFGATRPINLSGTISGEAVNRRVQFTLAPLGAPAVVRASDN
jgi:outer membrane protein OmpA-like peptidoglycan-associated protein